MSSHRPTFASSRQWTGRRTYFTVGLCCVLVQLLSATFIVRDFTSPNASTEIARNLVSRGEFAAAFSREGGAVRAFQLPGEPLYLAAGFAILPDTWHRYVHVPVVLLFVLATTFVARMLGGPVLALAAGTIATLDPFVVAHGPVWDDTMLAAALDWTVIALLVERAAAPRGSARSSPLLLALIASMSAWAAVTRLQSQIVLSSIAVAGLGVRRLKEIRPESTAIGVGVAAALGAWGVRNLVVVGAFIIGSTHDGATLLHANHPLARQSLLQTGVTQTYADLSLAKPVDEVAENRIFRERAVHYLVSHPVDAMTTAGLKIAVSLTGADLSKPTLSARNVIAVTSNLLWLTLGVAGIGPWRRRTSVDAGTERSLLLAIVCVAVVIGHVLLLAIGPVGLRYRISLAPLLYLGAAAALLAGNAKGEIR